VFAMTRGPHIDDEHRWVPPRTFKSTDWLFSSFQPTTESTC